MCQEEGGTESVLYIGIYGENIHKGNQVDKVFRTQSSLLLSPLPLTVSEECSPDHSADSCLTAGEVQHCQSALTNL